MKALWLACVLVMNCVLDDAFGQILVAIKNGTAKRYDAKTGASLGAVGGYGATAASTDGVTVAVLFHDGRVRCYDARSGASLGAIGSGKASSVQVSSGIIVIGYNHEQYNRYDARSGASLGAL